MRRIPLSNSKKKALVDDEDYEIVMAVGPWRLKNGYAVTTMTFCDGEKMEIEMGAFVLGVQREEKKAKRKR